MDRRFSLFFVQLTQVWKKYQRKSIRVCRNGRGRGLQARGIAAQVETLELRTLLAATNILAPVAALPTFELTHPFSSAGPSGYSPSQLQAAYGFNSVTLQNGVNGTGQTIAIVDAYNAPTILSDLQAFDRAFGLADPPSLTVMSQTGSTTSLPPNDPNSNKALDWEVEEALDVEWAHALAPGAKIVLVEANSPNFSDLLAAVRTAANLPGVSVVSMSWGSGEFASELSYDATFTTPAGHLGVTFVASSGDSGAGAGYPAISPNVLAVGGTTLSLSSSGTFSESGWSGSGGGASVYETQPAYQKGIVTQTTTKRSNPDVAFDADPNTGVPVYDTFSNGTTNPWSQIGGTSLSAPAWAAVISIVDQGRSQNGLSPLDGASQTLPMLYQLDLTNPSAFHDITTGSNGFSAGPGYDLVTGIGTPLVNVLVSGLSGVTSTSSKLAITLSPTTGTAGVALGTATVAVENQSGQVVTGDHSTVTVSIASGPGGFASGSTISVAAVNGVATFSNLVLNVAGSYTLSFSDTGLTGATSSTLTISAAQAAKVVFQQQPTTSTSGQVLNPAVTVAVEDQFGNVVTNNSSQVTIAVASGPGLFSSGSTTIVTAVNGIATFNNLVLVTAGSYTLRASDASLVAATSNSFTVNATQSASKLVIQQSPTTGTAGVVLGAVSVAIESQSGQVVTSDHSTVTLSIASGPGGFTSGSTISVAAINGVATFNNLVLNTAGTYTLSASDTGLTGATSQSLTISAAPAAKVVFQQQPTTTTSGQILNPAVTVAVEDQFGNVVTNNNSQVTIAVASGPGLFSSGSTTVVTAVNGIATFNNLILGTAGSYTLRASDASLVAATSNSFTVNALLTAPQNVTVIALTPTTAQITWQVAIGAQGYRIYQVIGSQSVLLGTASSSTTSFQVSGLTAGSTVSFKVEAFSGTAIADSPVVSITMPPNVPLGTPVLTIQILTANSVQLNWNTVSGTEGFRIYTIVGGVRTLLGTVGPGVTSAKVVGLQVFATYQFQIEAFQGTTTKDSAWVSVNTLGH